MKNAYRKLIIVKCAYCGNIEDLLLDDKDFKDIYPCKKCGKENVIADAHDRAKLDSMM